jgi:glutamate formiminotransferase
LIECVVNISEGQRLNVLQSLSVAAGPSLRNRHNDRVHNRSVFTLINGENELRSDVRSLIAHAMEFLDLATHKGVHPRLGVVDVVPFVALKPMQYDTALGLRDETAHWIASTFSVPVFLYGELKDGSVRSLPDIRREAFQSLVPDEGPQRPHPHLGASAVGTRDVLMAWNICLKGTPLEEAKKIAASIRQTPVRSLAFQVGGFVQISCNLIDPLLVGPSVVYDAVSKHLETGVIDHCELVGLVPVAVLRAQDERRWQELGLSLDATIEAQVS